MNLLTLVIKRCLQALLSSNRAFAAANESAPSGPTHKGQPQRTNVVVPLHAALATRAPDDQQLLRDSAMSMGGAPPPLIATEAELNNIEPFAGRDLHQEGFDDGVRHVSYDARRGRVDQLRVEFCRALERQIRVEKERLVRIKHLALDVDLEPAGAALDIDAKHVALSDSEQRQTLEELKKELGSAYEGKGMFKIFAACYESGFQLGVRASERYQQAVGLR